MSDLESEIRSLASRYLDTTDDTPANLLRRIGRQIERQDERIRVLEDAIAGAGETLQELASTKSRGERSSLAETLQDT